MALKLNLLVIGFFLLIAISFCDAKTATVKVVGHIHCTDCIKNQPTSSNASLGVDVLIICKVAKSEEKTEGNGAIDKEGKFNVTLSAEITQHSTSIDGCYAKLQNRNDSSCPIQGSQTASVKILTQSTDSPMNTSTLLKFSPVTCQSAFFWPFGPFPNLKFFSPPSPPDYTPPPEEDDLSPLASPVQPPSPPPETLVPSLQPPANEIRAPSPSPETNFVIQPPALPPQAPAPRPVYKKPPTRPITPPPTAGVPAPTPRSGKPSAIPKAPPIPRLPLTPNVPRKYFNAPKSKSKPPRYA